MWTLCIICNMYIICKLYATSHASTFSYEFSLHINSLKYQVQGIYFYASCIVLMRKRYVNHTKPQQCTYGLCLLYWHFCFPLSLELDVKIEMYSNFKKVKTITTLVHEIFFCIHLSMMIKIIISRP